VGKHGWSKIFSGTKRQIKTPRTTKCAKEEKLFVKLFSYVTRNDD